MWRLGTILGGGSLLVLLAACAGTDNYDAATAAEPPGTAFERNLHAGYLELATAERKEYDWKDGAHFSDKALAVAQGRAVRADEVGDRDLPEASVETLSAARKQLVGALAAGAAREKPAEAARAQVSFDCWMQEQEEDIQPDDIAACRDAFNSAMAAIGDVGLDYVVYFGLDSDKLSEAARNEIMTAAAVARANSAAKIVVDGHADKAGGTSYNMELGERRAAVVKELLLSVGVKAEQIQSATYGEAQPAVETDDNVPELKNRRVEIKLVK
ncbi:MAG: OmpA family protein [Rhodospirillales bacterium]|nr:OmpA family protein [Rhodospirillales bacterium]